MNKIYYDTRLDGTKDDETKNNETKDKKVFTRCIAKYYDEQNKGETVKFVYVFHEDDLLKKDMNKLCKGVEGAISSLKEKGIKGNDFTIAFLRNKDNGIKTNTACKVMGELEKRFKETDIKMLSGDLLCSASEIAKANSKIDTIVEKIKSKNLSPVEQLMYAYKEVTKHIYTQEDETDSIYLSRDIYGVLNSDRIVCVGYSELFKEIVSRLELGSNAHVFLNLVEAKRSKKENGKDINYKEKHENCIVYIKDEKYGIDGYYYCDPTWDAQIKDDKMIARFSYFLLPLGEIMNMRKDTIKNLGYLNNSNRINYQYSDFMPRFVEDISLGEDKAKLSLRMKEYLDHDKDMQIIKQNDKDAQKYSSFEDISMHDPELVYSLLKQKSKTIRVDKMITMLTNVAKADNPEKTDEEVSKFIQKIYTQNYKMANEKIFNTKSLSYFSKHQNRTMLHDKNLPKQIKDVLQSVQQQYLEGK